MSFFLLGILAGGLGGAILSRTSGPAPDITLVFFGVGILLAIIRVVA